MLKSNSFSFILLTVGLMAFAPRPAQGAEPVVEIGSQDTSDSTGSAAALLARIPVHFSLGVSGGYDDNVGTSGGGQGSAFTSENASVSYNLRSERTQLSVLSSTGITYFFEGTSTRMDDVDTHLDLSFNHKYSLRLALAATVFVAYQTEPNFSSDVGPENRRGNFLQTSDTFSASYNWFSRFSTVTSYTFRLVQYDNSSIGMLQDRSENTFGEEFRFDLLRRTTVTGEYRFQIVDYDSAPRDSITHFALVGINQNLSEQLKLVLKGGATFRSYNDDGDRTDPHFEGSVNYAISDRSFVDWIIRYGIEEPNSAVALTRTTFRTGLELKYGLSARLNSTAAIFYHHDENQGALAFSEDALDLSVGLHYAINRRFTFDLNFYHSEINSDQSMLRDYSRNRYSAGLNFNY